MVEDARWARRLGTLEHRQSVISALAAGKYRIVEVPDRPGTLELVPRGYVQLWIGVRAAAVPEPMPTGRGEPVTEQLIEMLRQRSEMGVAKYGTVLRTNNGRNALMDALQESLDMNQYLMQRVMELDRRGGLDDLVRTYGLWAAETFVSQTPESICEHLRREVEELTAAPNDAEEMADVVLLIANLAYTMGVSSLAEVVNRKAALNRTREWGKPDASGVVEHVEARP